MAQAAPGNLHSRVVAVLKLVLPLLALVLLSTLFLFSRKIDPEDAIPYAEIDIADRLREPKMTEAGFASVTADGAALTIGASEAKPTTAGGEMRLVQGRLDTADGQKIELVAASARLISAEKQIELSGGAEFRSSSGFFLTSDGLGLATDRTLIESRGAVLAEGPIGQLTADHMVLSQQGSDGPYLLVFNGKVRLLYQPDK